MRRDAGKDPPGAVCFQSGLPALKKLLIVGSFLGLACSAVYICLHPAYREELNLPFF